MPQILDSDIPISPLASKEKSLAQWEKDAPSWLHILRLRFDAAIYQDWIQPLWAKWENENHLEFYTSSRFLHDWIQTHYWEDIVSTLKKTLPHLQNLTLTFKANPSENGNEKKEALIAPPSFQAMPIQSPKEEFSGDDEHHIPSAALDPRFTFERFVVGKPNEFAYAAARRVAESDQAIYNPLFLYGPVGLGKTHLMHSIAHTIQEKHQGKKTILYLSAEKFMYYFIRALRYRNVVAFKERFRSVHVLMIDDVQFISGKESTQEEFFHTFNSLVDNQRQVVISADKSPSDLEGIQERMKSRLGWGLAVDLHPTNYELRLGILQAKVQQDHLCVPENVLSFLAENIVSSVRELEGALNRVVAHSTFMGKEPSLDFAMNLLKDLLKPQHRAITLEQIVRKICDHFHLRASDLYSPKRIRSIARPRQIAMFLAKNLTSISLPMIGRHFGGRDHTTVLHAVQTIESLIKTDDEMVEHITLLRNSLENR